jgi:chromate reductase, NAD(P)H dehydrogenase (quinone)
MTTFKIAIIVGSNRRESLNRKLAHALVKLAGERLAFTFVRIDNLLLYNQDLEGELSESVVRFKAEIEAADGLLFVMPEHNRSLPAVLKNAVDWGARPYGQNSWTGKAAAITGTSPGSIGTALGQQHLRQILSNLGVLVMGGEAYISFKPGLLDANDNVADASTREFLKGFIDQFASLVARISPRRPQSTPHQDAIAAL